MTVRQQVCLQNDTVDSKHDRTVIETYYEIIYYYITSITTVIISNTTTAIRTTLAHNRYDAGAGVRRCVMI